MEKNILKQACYFDSIGILIKKEESLEEYIERAKKTVNFCEDLRKKIINEGKAELEHETILKEQLLEKNDVGFQKVKNSFDFDLSWIIGFYDSSIGFLQGAAEGVYTDKNISDIPFICLKPSFKNNDVYLKMYKKEECIVFFILVLWSFSSIFANMFENRSIKKTNKNKMLLVISAPSINDEYYSSSFKQIVDFQIRYINSIINNDNVILIVDLDTKSYYDKKIPESVILTEEIYDIWMRDFTTVNPLDPVQFKYTWASMTKKESEFVQKSFIKFANKYDIKRNNSNLLLDGGNIVDNYAGKVITTTRFLEDNDLNYREGKKILKKLLGATEVAILEPDEEVLAHSDGMVMWIDEEVLLVNNYKNKSLEFRENILAELKISFPTTRIIEVPVKYKENKVGEWEGFSSACGINLNSVMTPNNIYVPVFNMSHDQEVVKIIKQNTSKNVILINAEEVSHMGGSVRCLTWQITGVNAEKLVLAAKEK
jgi:agmatine/peptidylarginine deiminase